MSTAIPKPPKKKGASKKEPRPCMDEFEQQEAAELIQLAVQDETELVFTVYRKYKEPDIIQGKIVKLEQQMGRILVSDGPNAIHKIQFMDILKIETPS
ncbi:YolD-like family protein [Bacillus thuringiensis]|uniref:YolD-like family protein n=1 Tax=Bacillus thuringiensis subsp. tolworthi TaxID=1442 RepID=A0A9W4EVY3_BACTO|nr:MULTISPECIES: YolD-like family protein [Bacillus cereus group]KAB1364756.1 YolD-like family protein [Bacillus thuringiensis]KIP28671.1 yolD-like family protein [Bacillus thuringiensis serovar morrisoni]MCT6942855.1 YolD-like family protein [Bacillus thuringiensis]MDA2525025.1 YolD-like family protein [Bacillus cereus]MDA2560983.1 YolD-like family protein [Bacillus cereus]